MTSDSHAGHVFGPVPSRRLGRSLGVDIVPAKVCSLDCIYCQVGRTTRLTADVEELTPIDIVLAELREKLAAEGPRPDTITLAGSGEPTLHTRLGDLIDGIHAITDVPVAVLTNGTLLWQPTVREACRRADLVLPSLDAGDEAMFRRINRPADGLTLERTVQGMADFREVFTGAIWLEVFLARGLNDAPDHVAKIAALAARIRPDKVQLNTAVRPTADADVAAVEEERLQGLCALFGDHAEVIADFHRLRKEPAFAVKADDILDMIRRRPVTLDDIVAGRGAHPAEIMKYIEELTTRGAIVAEVRDDKTYYRATRDA